MLIKELQSSFDPNENNERNEVLEKTANGIQFPHIHRIIVLILALNRPWLTSAHTPKPLYANTIPMVPDIKIEIIDALA